MNKNNYKDTLQQIQNRFPTTERKVSELISHIESDDPRLGFYEAVMKNQVDYCDKCIEVGEETPVQNIIKQIAVETLNGFQPLHEMIGIQPMSGPVGLIYKLRTVKHGGKMALEVISQTIEASSRKLSARVNIEPIQDSVVDGVVVDIFDKDIQRAVGQEIADEYSAEIVGILTQYAKSHIVQPEEYGWRTVKYSSISTPENFLCTINVAANRIADRTRRGSGNFIIINQKILDVIKDNRFYVPFSEEVSGGYLKQVGWLNDHYKVFLDKYDTENNVIVGYKGPAGETDAGLFFAPYVPVMSTGIVINPVTFEPVLSFMTRYRLFEDEMSKDYYSGFNISFDK